MPNETNYLVSHAATRKHKNTGDSRSGAEIVALDDWRPRETWRRVDTILARLRLLAMSDVADGIEIVIHPPPRARR